MKNAPPLLNRKMLRLYLDARGGMLDVKAAEEGRFILKVPDFGDGLGPVLLPNIKELGAHMRGSEGSVQSIELEAGPQRVPADGTNVIVINRVDNFVQMALAAKLEYLIDGAHGEFTRQVLEEFMGYARGYTYDAKSQIITFSRNAGFRNDVYNMPISELKKRYTRHSRPDLSLEKVKPENIRSGYYVKKPLPGLGVFLEGAFCSHLSNASGGALQEFEKGAMVHVPLDPALSISFIHMTDINTCYTRSNGWNIVDPDGHHCLPVIKIDDLPDSLSATFSGQGKKRQPPTKKPGVKPKTP